MGPPAPPPCPPAATATGWTGDAVEASPESAPRPAVAAAQLPLFPPDELAAASPATRRRRRGLPGRIRSLLGGSAAEAPGETPSFWPDSFFDEAAGA